MSKFSLMQRTYVTYLPHFLRAAGDLPTTLPVPARRLAQALCQFVSYATNFDGINYAMPRCFVVIRSKRCQGRVMSLIEEDDNIVWHCTTCHSHGVITGWQGTLWDLSESRQLQ